MDESFDELLAVMRMAEGVNRSNAALSAEIAELERLIRAMFGELIAYKYPEHCDFVPEFPRLSRPFQSFLMGVLLGEKNPERFATAIEAGRTSIGEVGGQT